MQNLAKQKQMRNMCNSVRIVVDNRSTGCRVEGLRCSISKPVVSVECRTAQSILSDLKSVLTAHMSPLSCQNRLYRPLDPPLPDPSPSGSVRLAIIRGAEVRRPCVRDM